MLRVAPLSFRLKTRATENRERVVHDERVWSVDAVNMRQAKTFALVAISIARNRNFDKLLM